VNPLLRSFESSCFDSRYITGDVDDAYLDALEAHQTALRLGQEAEAARDQMSLQFAAGSR
jgi:amidophosphoribosyltransferase